MKMKWLRTAATLGPILAAFAAFYFGLQYDIPLLLYIGLALIGITALVTGIESVITRRASRGGEHSDMSESHYFGLSAILLGSSEVLIGIIICVIAFILAIGLGDTALNMVKTYPGIVMIPVGLIIAVVSVAQVLGPAELSASTSHTWFVMSLPGRVISGIFGLLGLMLCALGLLNWIAPELFDLILEAVFGTSDIFSIPR